MDGGVAIVVMTAAGVLATIGVLVISCHVWAAARFRRLAGRMSDGIAAGAEGDPTQAVVPAELEAWARSNGGDVGGSRATRITQDVLFRRAPDASWGVMTAVQTIGAGTPGFVWHATGAGRVVPTFAVIDALANGRGLLIARLFGSVPVARAEGPATDRAEAIRYLAELPWAPDAILGNPEVSWVRTDMGWQALLDMPSGPVSVQFTTDAAGDITGMTATRPDIGPDGSEFTRNWHGRFGDYAYVGGRRIPTFGEVGYVENGSYWAYFRGHVTGLEVLR